MKYILLLISLSFLFVNAWAQESFKLQAEPIVVNQEGVGFNQFVLKNGLTVYIYEDKNMHDVLGAMIVKGGSKNDPADATGIAHYLEHMMFKGTRNIGTTDYHAERVYLDSINLMYDNMVYDTDTTYRKNLYKKIDYYSQKAMEYQIPGEFDKVISMIGGTGLNAYTDYERIVYLNSFPAERFDQWLNIYYERFDMPVFRLFQTEIEAVYEEKNMSMDNQFNQVFEELYKNFYAGTSYGDRTVLGSVEHLKTPSPSKMLRYFKENYQADNMAMVIIGNISASEALPKIEQVFGGFRNGNGNMLKKETIKPLDSRVEVSKNLTPVNIGVLGFRGVSSTSEDKPKIDFILSMLNNSNGTGILDSLSKENKLLTSFSFGDYHSDLGGIFVIYIPIPVVQSLKSGEEKVIMALEQIKNGKVDQEKFNSLKMEFRRQKMLEKEEPYYLLENISSAFLGGKSWAEIEDRDKMIDELTIEEVQRIAKKYFTSNYLAFYSKMGNVKPVKLQKPEFTPVNIPDDGRMSNFAIEVQNASSNFFPPKLIDFDTEVRKEEIRQYVDLYYNENPYNKVFSLTLRYGVGDQRISGLSEVAEYLNMVGTSSKPYFEFKKALQELGTTIAFSCDESYFYVNVVGFDENLNQSLYLVNQIMNNPEFDKKSIKKMVQGRKFENKMMKKDLATKLDVLTEYALYGANSDYLDRLSSKEIAKLTIQDIVGKLKQVQEYQMEIHYAGNKGFEIVKSEFVNNFTLPIKPIPTSSPVFKQVQDLTANKVYFINDKKAIQSHLSIVVPGKRLDRYERFFVKPFNEYFGIGLGSVVFTQIREYRSLAYSAYSYFYPPISGQQNGYLYSSMSTQGDKTLEALTVFTGLIDTLRIDQKHLESIKYMLLNSINSELPGFRSMSMSISDWRKLGYDNDPRRESHQIYTNLGTDNLQDFYNKNILERKKYYNVVGNSKSFNLNELSKFGEVKEMDIKELYKK